MQGIASVVQLRFPKTWPTIPDEGLTAMEIA
jgi:hypothetical protein